MKRAMKNGSPVRRTAAFTLVELLIVISILGIFATIAMTSLEGTRVQSLQAASRVLASDLRLARSLSVEQNTQWTVIFSSDGTRYELQHTGSGNPPPPEDWLSGTAEQRSGRYLVNLRDWGLNGQRGASVQIVSITLANSENEVSELTFQPQGGTGPQRNQDTLIQLGQPWGNSLAVIPIRVSWVTGQVWVEELEYRPLNATGT